MHDFDPTPGVTDQLVGRSVADVERDLILATLRQTGGNRTRASEILGISIRTLRNKLAKYAHEGIEVPRAPKDLMSRSSRTRLSGRSAPPEKLRRLR